VWVDCWDSIICRMRFNQGNEKVCKHKGMRTERERDLGARWELIEQRQTVESWLLVS
jgi:hypothetical protein